MNPLTVKRSQFVLNRIAYYADRSKFDILDIGCGSGELALTLAELGHNVVAIDKDAELIKKCTEGNKYSNASFLNMDAHYLRCKTRFDVVTCIEVIEHTLSPIQVVQSIEAVLKPEGVLILTVPNGFSVYEVIINRILNRGGKSNLAFRMMRPIYGLVTGTPTSRDYPFCLDSLHLNFFTLDRVRELFKGFILESIEHTDLGLLMAGAGRMSGCKKIECDIADHLPHSMVGGWMMALRKK